MQINFQFSSVVLLPGPSIFSQLRGWLVQATDYRKLNEPPRPRLQRNGTIYLMARPPLLCQGGDFAFPAGCPRRPCPADDLSVMISAKGESRRRRQGVAHTRPHDSYRPYRISRKSKWNPGRTGSPLKTVGLSMRTGVWPVQ